MTMIHANVGTELTLTGRRLRVRRVNEGWLASYVADRAAKRGEPCVSVRHGGTVANKYGYPAETEAVLAVALDAETVVVWARRIPANKATLSGAAGRFSALFDGRTSKATKRETRERLIAEACKLAGRQAPRVDGWSASSALDGAMSPLIVGGAR